MDTELFPAFFPSKIGMCAFPVSFLADISVIRNQRFSPAGNGLRIVYFIPGSIMFHRSGDIERLTHRKEVLQHRPEYEPPERHFHGMHPYQSTSMKMTQQM